MPSTRRSLLAAMPFAVIGVSAAAATTDLSLACDTAAAPALRQAASAFRRVTGVRVFVHATPPGLLLPQLQRTIQNDILVTSQPRLDAAEQSGLLLAAQRRGAWRNRLVLATSASPAGPEGSIAAPDPSPGSDIDGPAVLRRLGLAPTLGVIDTETVAWLLATGGTRLGLLYQAEVATNPQLRAATPVPDDVSPPVVYSAAVTTLARRPDPQAFISFLTSNEGMAVMRRSGLEPVA